MSLHYLVNCLAPFWVTVFSWPFLCHPIVSCDWPTGIQRLWDSDGADGCVALLEERVFDRCVPGVMSGGPWNHHALRCKGGGGNYRDASQVSADGRRSHAEHSWCSADGWQRIWWLTVLPSSGKWQYTNLVVYIFLQLLNFKAIKLKFVTLGYMKSAMHFRSSLLSWTLWPWYWHYQLPSKLIDDSQTRQSIAWAEKLFVREFHEQKQCQDCSLSIIIIS